MEDSWIWVLARFPLKDTVFALPFLKRLLEHAGSRKVLIWTDGPSREILEMARDRGLREHQNNFRIVSYNPPVTHFLKSSAYVKKLAREFPPTLIFSLDSRVSSGLIAWLSHADRSIGFAGTSASIFFSELHARKWDLGESAAERYLSLLSREFPGVEPWGSKGPSLLSSAPVKRDLVTLHLWTNRRSEWWPLSNAEALLRRLVQEGLEVRIFGDPSAEAEALELMKRFPSPLVKQGIGEWSLLEWTDLIESSKFFAGVDSYSLGIASDLSIPSVGLFGPTLPEFGYAPWRRQARILGVQNLSCRPCHFRAPKICPKGHHKCLKDIDGDRVFQELQTVFKRAHEIS
jgi:heptosyltransferase II